VQKEPNLDFDLLVDIVLSSDNPSAVMDVKLSAQGMLLSDQQAVTSFEYLYREHNAL
jgi:hypothetical protein